MQDEPPNPVVIWDDLTLDEQRRFVSILHHPPAMPPALTAAVAQARALFGETAALPVATPPPL